MDIEEIPADTPIPDGIEECDVSLSEEPPDTCKSPRNRKKKEQKRKHENSSSTGEIVKKHERPGDVVHPPPPHLGPEPMELVDTEVYERPKEAKTPKNRRKQRSKENIPDNEIPKRPPQKPKSPKPEEGERNGCEVVKKVVRKKKPHVENGEPFERPEPRASPRPPRTPLPPEPEQEEEVVKPKKSSPPRQQKSPPRQQKSPPKQQMSPPIQQKSPPKQRKSPPRQQKSPPIQQKSPPNQQKSPPRQKKSPARLGSTKANEETTIENNLPCEDTEDSLPPPLPEKKHKSKSPKAAQSRKGSREEESSSTSVISPEVANNNNPSHVRPVSDEVTATENNEAAHRLELKQNDVCHEGVNNVSESSNTIEANSSVIQTKPSLIDNDKDRVSDSRKCEVSAIQSKLDATPSSPTQVQADPPAESASGKLSVSAESNSQPSQFSVPEVGCAPEKPGHETQAQDQIVSPKTNNINDLKTADKNKEENLQPLVKPFPSQPTNTKPLEFPPKTPDHSAIKPPWAKSDNKSHESVNKNKPSTDVPKPSINNLPKLVPQKSIEPLESVEKKKSSESTLPDQSNGGGGGGLLTTVELPGQQTKLPPLVVPFPGSVQSLELPASPTKKPPVSLPQQTKQMRTQIEPPPPAQTAPVLPAAPEPSDREREATVEPVRSGETLPKPQPLSPLKPLETQQSFQFPSTSSQPLELPQSQCPSDGGKQESPKLILNNIPKPFKAEAEKSGESIDDSVSNNKTESQQAEPTVKTAEKPVPIPEPKVEVKLLKPEPEPEPEPEPVKVAEVPKKKPEEVKPKSVSHIPIAAPPEPRRAPEPRKIQIIMKNSKAKSSDSIGSAISVSSTEERADRSDKSSPNSPQILPKPNGPGINMATLSPSSSGNNIPDKRDSKVIKAAAYWNNFIGEVTAKSRPPSNPKTMDKPKKIISAGIGEKGLKDLTTAFEKGKPIDTDDKYTIMRRNSKKMSVEPCNPGLRVNEAKSHFEKKFQSTPEPVPTPSMRRRASGTLEKPKWGSGSETPPTSAKNSDTSKSPSPVKADKSLTLPQPITKNRSPETEIQSRKETATLKPESKRPEIQRNTIVSETPITEPAVEVASQKPETISRDQPKPPTSPKPKVRKEELKLKEELVKAREDRPVTLTKKTEETPVMVAPVKPAVVEAPVMVAPIKPSGVEMFEEAKVVKTKDAVEKVPEKVVEVEKPQKRKDLHIQIPEPQPSPAKSILKTKQVEAEPAATPPPLSSQKETTVIKFNNEAGKEGDGKTQVKIVKIKSPEPASVPTQEAKIEFADVRSSLKKVPHIAVARKKSFSDDQPQPLNLEDTLSGEAKKPTVKTEVVFSVNTPSTPSSEPEPPVEAQPAAREIIETPTTKEAEVSKEKVIATPSHQRETDTPKERIIPIQFVNENRGPKPFKLESSRPQTPVDSLPHPEKLESPKIEPRREHHIPILVEGGGSHQSHHQPLRKPEEDLEYSEKLDNFNPSSISRRRLGSRKKRMSSAFSDSSMSDDDAFSTPFGGLQKYTSYGKHGLSQEPLYTLKKTRPPFAVTRNESFSSGEEDFDDDGFQEMTAENLFSTLLSRVKSLTRRIHDEHEEHLLWQQKSRLGPPKLNPGGTHARLERTAQRNSIKRDREAGAAAAAAAASRPPTSYSRQSSGSNYGEERNYGGSSYHSVSSAPTKIYNRSNSYNNNIDSDRYSSAGSSRYSTLSAPSKRYEDNEASSDFSSNVSVTSSQRLRPGYLPPPVNINNDNASYANRNTSTANPNELDAHTVAQSIISRAHDKAERSIPISIQRENSISVTSPTESGTSLQSSAQYLLQNRASNANDNQNTNSRYEDTASDSDSYGGRRVSRFLRPDFYDTPKEDSVYAKMREIDEDSARNYLRANAGSRSGKSGRSTPLECLTPQYCDTSLEGGAAPHVSEGQSQSRVTTLTRRNSMREPTSRDYNRVSPPAAPLPLPPNTSVPPYSRMNYTQSELPVENSQLYRRPIRPYQGAKSDGQLLNKHANVTLNIIAAAERKKRQSQSISQQPGSSSSDPWQEPETKC